MLNVFDECSGLTSVTIPNSVTSIGERVFSNCSNLESISVHTSNPNYEDCSGSNVIVEKSTRTLIVGCKGTEEIPNSVTSIGDYAFEGSGLTAVTIPNSVTAIDAWAFSYCSDLAAVTIPNSVTAIGAWAFYDCFGLTSVTIGSGVTSIGEWAFNYCISLTSMVMENATPITMHKNSFDDSQIQNRQITLYVPYGSKSAYEATDYYSEIFAEIVEMEPEISLIDNVVYIEPVEAIAGKPLVLSVKMKNTANIRGSQPFFAYFIKKLSTSILLKFCVRKICRIASESSNFAIRNVE